MSKRVIPLLIVATMSVAACAGSDPGERADSPRPPRTDATPATVIGTETDGNGTDGTDGNGTDGDGESGTGGSGGGVATEQLTDDQDAQAVDLHIQGTFTSAEASGCNSDSFVLQMTAVLAVDQGDIVGVGDGRLEILDRGRCPGTDYGGQRTVRQPTVEIIGSADSEVWVLSFNFDDEVEAYLSDGTVYGSGPLLDTLATYSTATNAQGAITSVTITHEQIDAEEPIYFMVQTPTDTGSWIVGGLGIAFGTDGNTEQFVEGINEAFAAATDGA